MGLSGPDIAGHHTPWAIHAKHRPHQRPPGRENSVRKAIPLSPVKLRCRHSSRRLPPREPNPRSHYFRALSRRQSSVTPGTRHNHKRSKTGMRRSQESPPIRSKIIVNSDWWSPSVFDAVDWSAHGKALTKLHQHRTTLIKYIHKILPLGSRVNKYDKKYPLHCPSCREPKENWDHFWKCQARARIAWRRQFLKDLNEKLISLKTGPDVRALLVEKLRAVLDGIPPSTIPVEASLEEIGSQQDQIGWDQIMRGRFGWAWQTHA